MSIKLEANNIKCTDTKGKVYYTHLHWLKKFLPLLSAERKEIEVQIKGVYDKEFKGVVNVIELTSKSYTSDFYDTIVEALEKGEQVIINSWIFELVKFNKPLTR